MRRPQEQQNSKSNDQRIEKQQKNLEKHWMNKW